MTRTYRLVDAITGETHSTQDVRDDERSQREWKGWLLRTCTAYKRRTGHKLNIVRIDLLEKENGK